MGPRLRLTLVAGFSGALFLLLGLATRDAAEGLLEVPPPSWGMSELTDAVVAGTCTIGALGALWHLVSAVLALIVLPGSRAHGTLRNGDASGPAARILAGWGAPAVRRIAASALVVSLSSAPALAAEDTGNGDDLGWRPTSSAPASPTPSPTLSERSAPSPSASRTEPDEPDEPSESVPPTSAENRASTAPDTGATSERTHTVQPGESLWSVTAGLLPADAGPAQIAQTWPVLYRANVETIGPNPSLIRPGAVLSIPSTLTTPTTTGGQPPSH